VLEQWISILSGGSPVSVPGFGTNQNLRYCRPPVPSIDSCWPFVGNALNHPKFNILCRNTYLVYTITICILNIIISSWKSLIQVIKGILCTYFTFTSAVNFFLTRLNQFDSLISHLSISSSSSLILSLSTRTTPPLIPLISNISRSRSLNHTHRRLFRTNAPLLWKFIASTHDNSLSIGASQTLSHHCLFYSPHP
jgi:hypothetical protein